MVRRTWAVRRAAILMVTLLAGGCDLSALNRYETLNPSAVTETGSDIARTFDDALLVLPGSAGQPPAVGTASDEAVQQRLAALQDRPPLPTIPYMHGCTGLDYKQKLTELAQNGFAVIAPNSFARRYRPLQCRPSQRTGGENIFVYDFRLTEISYALHRMADLLWVDSDRMFLFGVSEGGVAAALYRGDEFRARVIAQWTCHGRPFVAGLAAPPGEPVLAVVRSADPWYAPERTKDQRGDCGSFFDDRPRSQSLVLQDGRNHDVLGDVQAWTAILQFLRAELRIEDRTGTQIVRPRQTATRHWALLLHLT